MLSLTTLLSAPAVLGQDMPDLGEAVPSGLEWRDWAVAGGVFVGFVIAGRLLRIGIERPIRRSDDEGQIARFVGRVVQNVLILVGLIYAFNVLGVAITPLIGALGIAGLAIAIALQAILENVFASVVIKTRKPIAIGDEITTNDHMGRVEAITFRTVILRNPNGETVVLPSSLVNSEPIVNHTERGTRRTVLPVGVAYGTNLRLAQQTFLAATAGVDGVLDAPEPRAWVTEFGESSINFMLTYWHLPDNATANRVRSGVAIAVKDALDAVGIEIPFPQRVVTMADTGRED
jgi:small-conductance mechanosensitive channel